MDSSGSRGEGPQQSGQGGPDSGEALTGSPSLPAAGQRNPRIAAVAAGVVLILLAVAGVAFAATSVIQPSASKRVSSPSLPSGSAPKLPVSSRSASATATATHTSSLTPAATTPVPAPTPRPKLATRSASQPSKRPTASPSQKSSITLPNGAFQLRNLVTGKCIRMVKAALILQKCHSGEAPWRLERTRTVKSVQLYRLRMTAAPRNCIDLPNYGVVPETTLLGTYGCTNPARTDNQEFRVYLRRYGKHSHAFALINWKNQMCLDVGGHAIDGSDRRPGGKITMYRCQDKVFSWDDHLWMFDR